VPLRTAARPASALPSLLSLLLGACAPAGPRDPVPVVSVVIPPRLPAAASATAPTPEPPVEVLYTFDWPGWDVQLMGVDTGAHRAFLWMESDPPGRVALDTVDYVSHQRVDRWEATPANAAEWAHHGARFRPLTGSLQTDLARFASLLEHADGVFHNTLGLVPGGKLVFYGVEPTRGHGDGDWWMAADRSGRPVFRFAPGLIASYSIAFSPDGRRAAWSGCKPLGQDGCAYHLYLSAIDGPPIRVDAIPRPAQPFFSRDGETVFSASYHDPGRVCFTRVPFARPGAAVELHCTKTADSTQHLVPDPAEETVVLAAPTASGGFDYEYTQIRLADGAVLGTHVIPHSDLEPVLDAHHRLFTSLAPSGLAVLDLATSQRQVWTEAELGGDIGYLHRVDDDGKDTIFARRSHRGDGRFELVRLNLVLP